MKRLEEVGKGMMESEDALKLKGLAHALSFAALHEDFDPGEEDLLGIAHIIDDISKSVEKKFQANVERIDELAEMVIKEGS
ncbi:uncharacterized protein Dvar_19310 [Desulfosarcina variabilis str. Montpellier]|uniref:hypothetical protein n=1 Tax=Desulfosarcina variabilis TaxID=2300 RepID=UPI003AFAEC3A